MNLLEKDDCLVGFRPENFTPTADARGGNLRTFAFHVDWVEHLGADRLVYGKVEGTPEGGLTIAKIPSLLTIPIEAGETHDFIVQESDLRFFDKETGVRIEPRPF